MANEEENATVQGLKTSRISNKCQYPASFMCINFKYHFLDPNF